MVCNIRWGLFGAVHCGVRVSIISSEGQYVKAAQKYNSGIQLLIAKKHSDYDDYQPHVFNRMHITTTTSTLTTFVSVQPLQYEKYYAEPISRRLCYCRVAVQIFLI